MATHIQKKILMPNSSIRVRFAPAPTGTMHIGNIRAALLNFLFAKQKHGTCILRIEDTDAERNYDPNAYQIQADLKWLSLFFDEGPENPGLYGPYFQSERNFLYQTMLKELISKNTLYQCFCTIDELEKKRIRQISLKQPPRYDRTCLKISAEDRTNRLNQNMPYIWRFKLNTEQTVSIHDLARHIVTFDYAHFSDFPITREDGSFTFLFANAVDDIHMKITHIFRGEDHLTNTALQAAIFCAFNIPLPTYWHMPILCNIDGKKLSKRDFGFSLHELKNSGFLPEAIINYLGILGASFKEEILTLDDLIQLFDFTSLQGNSRIIYDSKKLEWINHKWIQKKTTTELLPLIKEKLLEKYSTEIQQISDEFLITQIEKIKPELKTINDVFLFFSFYFETPVITKDVLQAILPNTDLNTLITLINIESLINDTTTELKIIKEVAKAKNISMHDLYHFLRFCLMGSVNGPSIVELIDFLGKEKAKERIMNAITTLTS